MRYRRKLPGIPGHADGSNPVPWLDKLFDFVYGQRVWSGAGSLGGLAYNVCGMVPGSLGGLADNVCGPGAGSLGGGGAERQGTPHSSSSTTRSWARRTTCSSTRTSSTSPSAIRWVAAPNPHAHLTHAIF